MKSGFYLSCFASLLLSFFSHANFYNYADNEKEKSLFIVGSTSVAKLIEVTKEPFYKKTGYRILIRALGSDKGIVSIGEQLSDLGMISRYLSIEEQKKWPRLRQVTIGQDAIVFIANDKNPISSLTSAEVAELYTSRSPVWPNTATAVTLLSKRINHGTHNSFIDYFNLESTRSENHATVSFKKKGVQHLFSSNKVKAFSRVNQAIGHVFRIKDALAYESLGAYQVFLDGQEFVQTRLMALDDIPPITNGNVNPNYPLRRPLNIVLSDKPSQIAMQYIAFLKSEQGQRLLKEHYFIPLP